MTTRTGSLINVETLRQMMCDALRANQAAHLFERDDETSRLHLAFVRAHGAREGRLTTFSTPRPPGLHSHATGWTAAK
jgi:hypothetical protein